MTALGEALVIAKITEPVEEGSLPSIQPLIEYLRHKQSVGPALCNHLADLLDAQANTPYRLQFSRRDNRRLRTKADVDRDVRTYRVFSDLIGQKIDEKLHGDILALLPDWTMRKTRNGWELRDETGDLKARYRVGTEFSIRQSSFIAAVVNGEYEETVRKMVVKLEAALNGD